MNDESTFWIIKKAFYGEEGFYMETQKESVIKGDYMGKSISARLAERR